MGKSKRKEKLSGGNWICIIGASRSQVPFIQAAHNLGLKTLVFDRDVNAPGANLSTYFVPISAHDFEGIVSECKKASKSINIVGCFTYVSHERAWMASASVTESLGLHGYSLDTVKNTSNKNKTKNILNQAGISTPEFCLTNDIEDVKKFIKKQRYAIIKPSSGGRGSIGVGFVDYDNSNLSHLFDKAQQESLNNEVLVEAYYPGIEYSIDGYVQSKDKKILSITRKFTTRPDKGFIIEGFATISPIMEKIINNYPLHIYLSELCCQVVDALNINNTFFSIDVLVGEQGAMVIDTGLLLDAKIDRLLQFAGIDVYELRCLLALGQTINQHRDWENFKYKYALRFLFGNKSGQLFLSNGEIDFLHINGVRRSVLEWERESGDIINPPKSLADTIGWFIVETDDINPWLIASKVDIKDLFTIKNKE